MTRSCSRRRAHFSILYFAALTLTACGQTYIDASATTAPTNTTPPTTLAIDPNSDPAGLLEQMSSLMKHLDKQIVDNDKSGATLSDIERLWAALEPQLANRDAYRVGQTVELAQSGVTNKRPADASKGYKLLNDLILAGV